MDPVLDSGSNDHEVAVIGGGIVGLATAYALTRKGIAPVVLEKESQLAQHQTGRNSGVIHSGIYYPPGSAKARLCRTGRASLLEFCEEHDIEHDVCGKVIVATEPDELGRLEALEQRGEANGITIERLDGDGLREREPHAAGIAALHVADAGIVDYGQVCRVLAELIVEAGGQIRTDTTVTSARPIASGRWLECDGAEPLAVSRVINCGGLQADQLATASGARFDTRIVPFRGEYFELLPRAQHLVHHLIYPVPDPQFPFLGVHFTRMLAGGVHAGPNAVLALAREGYTWGDINVRELIDTLRFPGFRRLAVRHWRMGLGEMWRSANRRAFVAALQRLVPEVQLGDLEPSPAGVRAQALRPSGELVDDFDLVHEPA
ncbi:MAG: L-2-hydroxyglutarate oxidase, partial [Acidimicrobiales bacterium]